VLYVLFNEGHLSVSAPRGIRAELCDEAIRLTSLLAAHPCGAEPSTFALLALMHLHAARLNARSGEPGLLLLEEQDRSDVGRRAPAAGRALALESRAGLGADAVFTSRQASPPRHCFAPSFVETNWRAVAALYEMLERIDPSPLHTANRAVAVAQVDGPAAGLSLLSAVEPPPDSRAPLHVERGAG
jgi:predicted RNA polymerase sigma factor